MSPPYADAEARLPRRPAIAQVHCNDDSDTKGSRASDLNAVALLDVNGILTEQKDLKQDCAAKTYSSGVSQLRKLETGTRYLADGVMISMQRSTSLPGPAQASSCM